MNPDYSNYKPRPRDVVQFSAGPKKGIFAQVISSDGKCLTRDMDGSQYAFNPGPEDTFIFIGVAALGPKVDEPPGSLPAVPPTPEEIQKLLEPLPPEVKAVPMGEAPEDPDYPVRVRRKIGPVKPPKADLHQIGPKVPYVFVVTNGLGDVAEVTLQVRPDKKFTQYKGAAIIQATKTIPNAKPYSVAYRKKDQ